MNEVNNKMEQAVAAESLLLESDIDERLVLEHPSYKQLEDKLTQAEQKGQEYWDGMLRAKAELENVQRRAEREIANAHKYALEKFASEVLVVVDSLERGLAVKVEGEQLKDFYAGIELTLKLLSETLQKFGVTVIDPKNESFDPTKHTAIATKEDPAVTSNVIIEVIQKGYWLKDRLLRPALVVVAK